MLTELLFKERIDQVTSEEITKYVESFKIENKATYELYSDIFSNDVFRTETLSKYPNYVIDCDIMLNKLDNTYIISPADTELEYDIIKLYFKYIVTAFFQRMSLQENISYTILLHQILIHAITELCINMNVDSSDESICYLLDLIVNSEQFNNITERAKSEKFTGNKSSLITFYNQNDNIYLELRYEFIINMVTVSLRDFIYDSVV